MIPSTEPRPDPKLSVSDLSVSPAEGQSVSIQMTFYGVAQYIDARTIAEQEGWQIDIDKTRRGSKLVAIVKDSTVMEVVDRLHDIGLSKTGNMKLPERSLKL